GGYSRINELRGVLGRHAHQASSVAVSDLPGPHRRVRRSERRRSVVSQGQPGRARAFIGRRAHRAGSGSPRRRARAGRSRGSPTTADPTAPVPAGTGAHPGRSLGTATHHAPTWAAGAQVSRDASLPSLVEAFAARQDHFDGRHLAPGPRTPPVRARVRSEGSASMSHRVDIVMITYRSAGYLHLSLPRLLDTLGDRDRVWLWH